MSLSALNGRVAFIFDEVDFDVDQIVGVTNIKITDIDELCAAAMAEYDPDFRNRVRPGDLLVGAANFGYGHPHYPPMRAMRHMGVAGVIAESFSPGYWRGEISMGFPQIACPGIIELVDRWDHVEIDWHARTVINHSKGGSLPFEPHSDGDLAMLRAGGLVPYLKQDMEADAR
jgi:3-isopropylmalate/(R)-2-methylmalate dehydratase small subunit